VVVREVRVVARERRKARHCCCDLLGTGEGCGDGRPEPTAGTGGDGRLECHRSAPSVTLERADGTDGADGADGADGPTGPTGPPGRRSRLDGDRARVG